MKYSLTAATLITIFATSLFAAEDFWLFDSTAKTLTWEDETGFTNVVKTYTVNDGVISFKESGNKESETIQTLDLTLPIKDSDGNSYTIAGIPKSGFGYNSVMKTVVLPSYIKRIGDYAFKNSYVLESVTLNDGLEVIGLEAFNGCKALKIVNNFFPDSVVDVQNNAFYGCSALECDVVVNSLTNMGSRAFFSSGITSFNGGNSPLSLFEVSTFYECNSLTNVICPKGLKEIGVTVF